MAQARSMSHKNEAERILSTWIIMMLLLLHPEALGSSEKLPDFSLPGIDGKFYTNADFGRSETLAVVFLSNHCRISQLFQDQLLKIRERFSPKQMGIVAISPNFEEAILPDELAYSDLGDSLEEMKKRAYRKKYSFPYLYDGKEQHLTKKLGVKITPTVFLYDRKRNLVYEGKIGNHETPNRMETSDLFQNIVENLSGAAGKIKRTKVFGTSIKFQDDLPIAEKVRARNARETVKLTQADERKLSFYLTHKTYKPKLFYVWQAEDKECRDNLVKISSVYKIFRKRGLRVFTVCISNMDNFEKALDHLKQSQMSSINFMVSGHEIGPLIKVAPKELQQITPFFRLIGSDGKMLIGGRGEISSDRLRIEIIKALQPK